MTVSLYEFMQKAVDIVGESEHHTNKIAATLVGPDFSLSCTNHWPAPIRGKIGTDTKIGNSSGTLHAETACILQAPATTEGARLFVTDPPCPNCMKNMAEAGIKALYIDHKGFDKDWVQRHGDHFNHMSMKIAEHAGISVYEIRRKEQTLVPIFEASEGYTPPEENPLQIEKGTGMIHPPNGQAFASAVAKDQSGTGHTLVALAHPAIGYTSSTLEEPEGKYSFILEPVNRLLMAVARHGLTIDPDTLHSSRVPTARELVNVVGAGLDRITIGDFSDCRDEHGLQALEQLTGAGILNVEQ